MANYSNGKLSKLITDSTLVLAALTGIMYLCGEYNYELGWNNVVGLGIPRPEGSFYLKMATGGMIVFCAVTFLLLLYWLGKLLLKKCSKKVQHAFGGSVDDQFEPCPTAAPWLKAFYVISIFVYVSLQATKLLSMIESASVSSNLHEVASLTTTTERLIAQPEELTYYGQVGSFDLFKRNTGPNTGEFVLVQDAEIKAMTLK